MHRCISAMLVASRDLKVWEDKFFVLIRSESVFSSRVNNCRREKTTASELI